MSAGITPVVIEPAGFLPIAIQSIDARILDMDLYLKSPDTGAFVLYRGVGVEFAASDRRRLIKQGVKHVYVPIQQHRIYRSALMERLDRTFHDSQTSRSQRTHLVRVSCVRMLEDLLLFPYQNVRIALVEDLSNRFAEWAADDNGDLCRLFDFSAHSFDIVTHLVNVGVGCGLLIREMQPDEPEQHAAFIQGALLHDIGKRHIPSRTLQKEGHLKPGEWELIHKHPELGNAELQAQAGIPLTVLAMVRDHHERLDGLGYPKGVVGAQLGFAARVCSVVDVFDAICSARPHRGPTSPLEALRIMEEGAGTQLDADVLRAWAQLVHRLIRDDPRRAVPGPRKSEQLRLSDFVQDAPVPVAVAAERGVQRDWQGELRAHDRVAVQRPVQARFVRQCKPYPVRVGEWFEASTMDISQGGVQLQAPWPLTINDVLELRLSATGGARKTHLACVVRIRRGNDGEWFAGLKFVGREKT